MDAVAEYVMATYVSAKAKVVRAASAANVDPVEELRAGWQTQIDFGLANPTLFRLLSEPDRVLHSPAAQSGQQVLKTRVHRIALTGRLRVSEHRAVALIQAAGIGVIQTLLSTPPNERETDLADELFNAVLRRIVSDAPALPEGEHVSAAVVLRAIAPSLDMLSDAERKLLAEWLDRAIDAP